jgi:hypothetical protein
MSGANWLQLAVLVGAVVATTPLLGAYLARVLGGGDAPGDRVFAPVERGIYRLLGVDPRGGPKSSPRRERRSAKGSYFAQAQLFRAASISLWNIATIASWDHLPARMPWAQLWVSFKFAQNVAWAAFRAPAPFV